ncbi:hypothetical protein AU468_11405 [Alkalispirochaeta sphaeroplastigenens]|uniref:Uncharacterized protein n=1 Tax=Alkalispirochaeta sphaeroplastigenens TaxID=1187066 RepID=A0A2S4JHP4_9SPIO|nr:hypothetical protein [Alkalispirochaeta sphaeroplastigenens]POQ98989.1 hypothetical protein AU468_11405 [Alkalispirochaeta sphaeroplastigenens]
MRISVLWFMDDADEVAYAQWCPGDYRTDAARRALRRIRRKMFGEAVARRVSRLFRGLRGSQTREIAFSATRCQKSSGKSLVCGQNGVAGAFVVSLADIRGVYDPNGTIRDGVVAPRRIAPSVWERFYFGEIQLEAVPQVLRAGKMYYIKNDPCTLLAIMALRARGVPTLLVRPLPTEEAQLTDTSASMADCNRPWQMKTGHRLNHRRNIVPTC